MRSSWVLWRGRRKARKPAKPPAPWGPHCFLWQNRHDHPFSKREVGRERREVRLFKYRQREMYHAE